MTTNTKTPTPESLRQVDAYWRGEGPEGIKHR